MTAMAGFWGLSSFWCPNFDVLIKEDKKPVTDDYESRRWQKKPREKRVKCIKLQALQRSLSEAQRLEIGVEPVKKLIREHKSTCTKCNSSV